MEVRWLQKHGFCNKDTEGTSVRPNLDRAFQKVFCKRYTKINIPVEYPDLLDTASFTDVKAGQYGLIGVVFHDGSLFTGHYTAVALDQPSGSWFLFNDASATEVDQASAHKGSAYILFYQKQ
jgi:ubiquitin C-terminal hydrolase